MILRNSQGIIYLNPQDNRYLTETLVLKIHAIVNVPKYIKQLLADFQSKKFKAVYFVLFSQLCDWLKFGCFAVSWHIFLEYFQNVFAVLQGANLNVLQTLLYVSLPLEGTFLLLEAMTSQGETEQ